MAARANERDDALIRICDLAGRPRGTGFLADEAGTMITSHEAVDGLARLVLHAPGDQVCLVEAAAITALPEHGLALVATEGLRLPPLPVAPHGPAHPDRRIRLRLPHRADGTVVGTTAVTYIATDRFHLLDEVYELALDRADLNRAAAEASGAPLIDAATGAVLAVVATALHAGHRASGFAVPLRAGSGAAPLTELLARNGATVPAYGPHLNLAGALRLAAAAAHPAAGTERAAEPAGAADTPASGDAPGSDAPGRADAVRDRPEVAEPLGAFLAARGEAAPLTLGLVGDPGTGRSTELARLAARRARGPRPAPTVCLRGADLRPGDGSVKDAVERSLRAAARGVPGAHDGPAGDPPHSLADAVADLARTTGRPLLVVLDGAEEMPPVLAHALADWTTATAGWLRLSRARLIVACRPELWEQLAVSLPPESYRHLPIGPLTDEQAVRARARLGLPAGALPAADAAHPLALRLLCEVRAALPADPGPAPSRPEIFAAYLDLVCLRIAERLAAGARPAVRGTGVRRLAARVAGQVHEAARRCLGPGQGELDRAAFEELFPWRTGWAAAVLGEGLLAPAGAGYRFTHGELADWIQAQHLDLDAALHALVHRWFAPPGALPEAPVRLPSRAAARAGHPPPVPAAPPIAPAAYPRGLPVSRHRAGPVRQALLSGPPAARAARLHALLRTLGRHTRYPAGPPAPPSPAPPMPARPTPVVPAPPPPGADSEADTVPTPHPARDSRAAATGLAERQADAAWWATHLLLRSLTQAPDEGVLRELAGQVLVRAVERGGFGPARMGPFAHFGPGFWCALPLPVAERLALLRLLVPADGPRAPGAAAGGFLTAAADLLRAHPAEAVPAVCSWFTDDRPLQTAAAPPGTRLAATGGPRSAGSAPAGQEHPPGPVRPSAAPAPVPRPTVACAAQALLYAHRRSAGDHLTEALAASGHRAAGELLTALAEEEPSVMCRAVARWTRDERADRRAAAAGYGVLAASAARTPADRGLLRSAALGILARPQDAALHGAALAMLVRDPAAREQHLPAALLRFTAGNAQLTPAVLGAALGTHPEAVLAAFRSRLRQAADGHPEAAEGIMDALSAVRGPALARRAAILVEEDLRRRPAAAPEVARFLDARLEHGPGAKAVLLPLAAALLRDHPARVRRLLVPVFAALGTPHSRPLRQEMLDHVLAVERDPLVLDALLTAAADGCRQRHPLLTRELVHRVGLLLGRTPEGATHFDRRVVELAATEPDFARLLRQWLADGGSWDAVVGPSARRRLDTVA